MSFTPEEIAFSPSGKIIEQFSEDDSRVTAALSEGFCPDCHSRLVKCEHAWFHHARGPEASLLL
jgi:hypothetical protein